MITAVVLLVILAVIVYLLVNISRPERQRRRREREIRALEADLHRREHSQAVYDEAAEMRGQSFLAKLAAWREFHDH